MNLLKITEQELKNLAKEFNLIELEPKTFHKLITIYDKKGQSERISFIDYILQYTTNSTSIEFETAFNGFRYLNTITKYHEEIISGDKVKIGKFLGYSAEIRIVNPYPDFVETIDCLDSNHKTIEELLTKIPISAINKYKSQRKSEEFAKINLIEHATKIRELFVEEDLVIDAFNKLLVVNEFYKKK